MKKYKMTSDTIHIYGCTLHRIKALRNFGNVKKGDLGGWVESEENLSHEGNCWAYDNAVVCDGARVYDNAKIFGGARVFGEARVYDNADVCGEARVYSNAEIYGNAWVHGDAEIRGNACVYGNAMIYGRALVYGSTKVYGSAKVFGEAILRIGDVSQNASIERKTDYLVIGPIGSRGGVTTFYRDIDNGVHVTCGCFEGTLDEFEKAVAKTHGDSKYAKQYALAIQLASSTIAHNETK